MMLPLKILAILGCIAIVFGFLALDFIPGRILASLPPPERARTDRSAIELAWVNRGLYSLAAGGGLLVSALALFVWNKRKPPTS